MVGYGSSSTPARQQLHPATRSLSNFASFLSCAVSDADGHGVQQPLKACARKLPALITPSVGGERVCCRVPSLELRCQKGDSSATSHPVASSKPVLKETAVNNLQRPLLLRRHELPALPSKLLWNWSKSFVFLVDSRLQSCTLALVQKVKQQQSSSGGGQDELHARTLVRLLGRTSTSTNPIKPMSVVTSFRTLSHLEQSEISGDYIAPLVAEVVFDLKALGRVVPVKIEVPGTLEGSFVCCDGNGKVLEGESAVGGTMMLSRVELMIDADALLEAMMAQAREVVRQTIIVATDIASSVVAVAVRQQVRTGSDAGKEEEQRHRGDGSKETKEDHPTMPPPMTLKGLFSADQEHGTEACTASSSSSSSLGLTSSRAEPAAHSQSSSSTTTTATAVVASSGLFLLTAAMSEAKRRHGDNDDDIDDVDAPKNCVDSPTTSGKRFKTAEKDCGSSLTAKHGKRHRSS